MSFRSAIIMEHPSEVALLQSFEHDGEKAEYAGIDAGNHEQSGSKSKLLQKAEKGKWPGMNWESRDGNWCRTPNVRGVGMHLTAGLVGSYMKRCLRNATCKGQIGGERVSNGFKQTHCFRNRSVKKSLRLGDKLVAQESLVGLFSQRSLTPQHILELGFSRMAEKRHPDTRASWTFLRSTSAVKVFC